MTFLLHENSLLPRAFVPRASPYRVVDDQLGKNLRKLMNAFMGHADDFSNNGLAPLGILARAAHGSDNTFNMWEYMCEAWDGRERKVLQCLGLFCFLVVPYAIYLGMHLGVLHAGPDQLAKICFISALPFALLAYFDNAWSSNDAGPVCLAAWIAVCVAFSFKCTICVIGLAVTFFPFILSALLAHGFGAICRLFKDRICSPAAD
jgi:hypothetical protein